MQIYVCVKHVPDSAASITITGGAGIDQNIAFLINPFDEHAITQAVKIKNTIQGSEVIAICLGPDDAQKTLQSSLAMGADRGVLIQIGETLTALIQQKPLKPPLNRMETRA